jgi:hypothetical protein
VGRLLVVVAGVLALCLSPSALGAPARASGWCGSGEQSTDRPDVVTGDQFHLVYAVPADGTDNFASEVNAISDDAAAIQAWWAGQDPTRTVRIDEARFSGTCTAPDVSFLRLRETAAGLGTDANIAFAAISGEAHLEEPGKIVVVYYDGPQVDPNICGQGSAPASTAVVWQGSCTSDPRAPIVVHEMLHTLGAVPAGAPNACPSSPDHVCDSQLDAIYQHAVGAQLDQLFLDWNHDDYYGHSGSWLDVQDSPFLHRLDEPQVPLIAQIAGNGALQSDVPGLVCSTSCSTQWDPGTHVQLAATPGPGSRFVRWTSGCSGSDPWCAVTVDRATTVGALFGPAHVSVRATVSGQGRVECSPACGARYAAGPAVRFRAVPATGWRFVRWSGACAGTKPLCTAATDTAVSVHATFARLAKRR